MTARNSCAVLKDVIAYVDVWSSDKTANFSKPFVQQLQEMGAQVTKTFNKHVTHVVFKNGHMATWRKAKKSDVKLVSVLWVGRCYEDGVHASEELYPALDETNPLFKSKKHRCMQPKDSPERTPENDRRLRKKLDRMMKELIPKQPLVAEVSPIIIDEENGIVYSPGLKRSDYMAQRLKDMKEKRENLSPTASQIVESCSPTGLKPSLGNTPTHLKLLYEQSDDDSSASVAEPADYPDKKEARTQHNITEHRHPEERQRKASEKPWLAPCGDVPKRISSPSKCLDFSDHENEDETTLKEKRTEKHKQSFRGLSESSSKDGTSDSQKDFNVEKILSLRKSFRSSTKSAKGKRKNGTTKSCSETNIIPDVVKSSSCLSTPASLDDAIVEPSKETHTPLRKTARRTPKAARLSLSSLVQCVTLSGGSKSVASSSADGDDDVFEDYFSPANSHQKSKKLLLPHLPEEGDTQIPFELGSVPKKRNQNRESTGSENNHSKKRKLEENQRGRGSTVAAGFAKIPSEGEDDNKQVSISLQKMVSKTMGIRTLVMTSMPTEKQHIVVQLVKTLGGFSIIDRVCESTTHVVSGGHRRTLNILLGITRGCWILSFEWILWSLEQRQWIPEEPYELSDQFPAAQICRLQRHLSAGEHQQDLFQSQPPMFVSQHSQPPAHSLVELIELCGGTVCKTVRQAGICIGKYSGRRPEGSRILSEQWVLDSITHLKLLPYDDYILE